VEKATNSLDLPSISIKKALPNFGIRDGYAPYVQHRQLPELCKGLREFSCATCRPAKDKWKP